MERQIEYVVMLIASSEVMGVRNVMLVMFVMTVILLLESIG